MMAPQIVEEEPLKAAPIRRLLVRRIVPAALLLLYAVECVWFIRTQSLTYDEPVHIQEGLDAWRQGRFEQYNDHPPLGRLLCALPLLNPKWQIDLEQLPEGFRVHHVSPDPISLAWRARLMNVVLGVVLGVLLWLEARKHFSEGAANFSLALYAFTPALVAHFSLATTDGAATLMIFATAVALRRWLRHSSRRNTVVLGVALGLLLLAKFSTLPMFALACVWLLLASVGAIRWAPSKWNWLKSVGALGLALVVLWAGYFFHVSRLTIHNGVLTASHPHWSTTMVKQTHNRFNLSIPVPAGEYIAGLRDLMFHNAHGQRAYFLGQVSPTGGWKLYYPVTILLKWPLAVLVLCFLGLWACARQGWCASWDFWILFSFPALYFLVTIFSHFNIGERHVLPLYPFALLLAAAAWHTLSGVRAWRVALCIVLALNALDVLRYAPSYLSYMNIAVNPSHSYRLLSDSNVDWGQGLIALRKYQDQHPDEAISLAYFGSVDPEVYGIHARPLEENERVQGTVVVGATHLSGQYLRDPAAYRWVLESGPKQVLNHCMYLFRVDP
jgi:hypothetical protein